MGWCETCLPGGLAETMIVQLTDKHRSMGFPDTSSAIYIFCADCAAAGCAHSDKIVSREPRQALDLSMCHCVGDVDKTFGFLDSFQDALSVTAGSAGPAGG